MTRRVGPSALIVALALASGCDRAAPSKDEPAATEDRWARAYLCLLGGRFGLSTGSESLADRCERQLYVALARGSESEPAVLESLWPHRCVGLVSKLGEDAPADAVAQFRELAPLVIRPDENTERPFEAGAAVARARALAGPINALGDALEWHPGDADTAPPPPGMSVRWTRIGRGHDDEVIPAPHFLGPRREGSRYIWDSTYDRVIRSEGPDGDIQLVVTTRPWASGADRPSGPREDITTLDSEGLVSPHFFGWSGRTSAWLSRDGRRFVTMDPLGQREEHDLPLERPATELEVCEADTHRHLALQMGDDVGFVRWPFLRDVSVRLLRPTPPLEETIFICSTTRAFFLWREGRHWVGSVCTTEGCSTLPPLRTESAIYAAANEHALLVVGHGRRTDLGVAWRLLMGTEDAAWSNAFPLTPRPLSNIHDGRFSLSGLVSRDGLSWETYFDP